MSSAAAETPAGAYQGAPGAFSEDAARAMLGPTAHLQPCATLEDVFAALVGGRVGTAVVPIENTLAGAVPGCADLIGRHRVQIVAERVQPIVHALIAAPGAEIAAIRRVLSHPVAMAQCEVFLRAHPAITPVPAFDTAGALGEIIGRGWTDAAAIAGRRAASVYGGVVLADAIQDRDDNATRFLQVELGDPPTAWEPGRKTSLLCVLSNEPGSLVRALTALSDRGLNLSRLESRPTRETPFEYQFHLDIDPTDDILALDSALDELRTRSRSVRVLGHYVTS